MKLQPKFRFIPEGGAAEEQRFRKAQEQILNLPPHVGVVPLRQLLEDDKFFYIVMDRADDGPFFESLLSEFKDGVIPESTMKTLVKDILEAIRHVHKHGMLHRDIKPDNLVMHSHNASRKRVMLIDFDHADMAYYTESGPGSVSPCIDHTLVYGTLPFNAPETFHGRYSVQSDLYSVGVVLYLLMTGKMPYHSDIFDDAAKGLKGSALDWQTHAYQRMKRDCIDFDCSPWPEQPTCMDLCRSLLSFSVYDRPSSADAALLHPWLAQGYSTDR